MHPSRDQKLDCNVRVVTPENIQFEYTLAGPFQRLPAFAIDFVLRVVAFLAVVFLLLFLAIWLPPLRGGFLVVIPLLLFFLFSWFYGIYFESRYSGRTPGKMIFKLRVISVDGRPINATQAALRNLLRLADFGVLLSVQILDSESPPAFFIPTMIIGLVCMTLTGRMQRIGDLAAGTMVISEHLRRSPLNLQPEDVRAFGLAELIPASFQANSSLAKTLGLYMENRRRLGQARRNDIARHLAVPLIRRFDLLADTGPDLLLCALYVKTFLSEGQQEQGRAQLRRLAKPAPPVAAIISGQRAIVTTPVESALALSSDTPTAVDPPPPRDTEAANQDDGVSE